MVAILILAAIVVPAILALATKRGDVNIGYQRALYGNYLVLLLAVAAVINAGIGGKFAAEVVSSSSNGAGLGVLLDQVSSLMLLVVSVVAVTVIQFSERYLDGDARHAHYVKWLTATIAAVQLLVVSSNLVMLFGAWLCTSLALHQLLLMYPERCGAQRCARKKFIVSRLGDLAIVGAILLCLKNLGSVNFEAIDHLIATYHPLNDLGLIGILLALGALTKSAQLPFHSWLPESLEAPTTVSALMHAGIINGGGFLLIRMSSVMSHAPSAMSMLAILGSLTAVFGMAVMVTQSSIKRRLAYSTVGQMGFMMMQCGLGLYQLAMVHIVAHAFYKANAFLRSGSAISQARDQVFFPPQSRLPYLLAGVVVVSALVGLGVLWEQLQGGVPFTKLPIVTTWVLACLHAVVGMVIIRDRPIASMILGLGFAAIMISGYGLLCLAVSHYLQPQLGHILEIPTTIPDLVLFITAITFILGFVLQTIIHLDIRSEGIVGLFVHLNQGLYLGVFLDKIIGKVWVHSPGRTK